MSRKGQLKDMDRYEQSIRDNAVSYSVVCFQPGTSARTYASFTDLDYSIQYGKEILKEPNRIRSVMIYALDEYEHHALVGTIDRSLKYKEVVPKTH